MCWGKEAGKEKVLLQEADSQKAVESELVVWSLAEQLEKVHKRAIESQ